IPILPGANRVGRSLTFKSPAGILGLPLTFLTTAAASRPPSPHAASAPEVSVAPECSVPYRPRKIVNCETDFVGAVFLDKVTSLDRYLFLIRPGPAEIASRPGQDRPRLGIDEQLGDRTFGQPPAIVIDDGDDACRLSINRHMARPAQRGAAVFTRRRERGAVDRHFVLSQVAQYRAWQHPLAENVLLKS